MKLFTVGPVQFYEDTLKISSKQLPYFRTDEFSKKMLKIEKNIKRIVYTEDSSKVAILTASGTGAMEAVISSSFDESDKILIINGGSFGQRFCDICQIHNIKYSEIKIEFKEKLTKKHFENIDGSEYSAMVVNINETSTGQLYDINIIKDFAKKYNLYIIVDAISSFMADEYYMDKNNIDCTIVSSQKALALSPGLSIVIISEKFFKEKIENKPKKSLYLDLNEYIINMKRGQTPFTPALEIIYQLEERLELILKIGVDNIIRETKEKAVFFRNSIRKMENIEILDYNLSNALTPIYLKNGNAQKVFETLKNKYDIYVTPSGGELKDYLLRIGHIGNLSKADFEYLLSKIGEVIQG